MLIPKESLAEIRQIAGTARREHYCMTLPWDDNGFRVLPAAVYMEHAERLREHSRRFALAVDFLATQFDQFVVEAGSRLGGLFRAEDSPTSKEIREKFSFETKVMPLPDANEFRVSVGDVERDRIRRRQAESPSQEQTAKSCLPHGIDAGSFGPLSLRALAL